MKLNIRVKGYLRIYDIVAVDRRFPRPQYQKGKLLVELEDEEIDLGELLREGPNIITTLGRVRVAELLAGLTSSFITAMAIGDGGAPQDDLLTPIVPTLSDLVLSHELERTTTINPVVTGQVLTFNGPFLTASLLPIDFINPANKVVNEMGLFCGDNVMFARKTFPSIPFAPGDRLGVIGNWIITVL